MIHIRSKKVEDLILRNDVDILDFEVHAQFMLLELLTNGALSTPQVDYITQLIDDLPTLIRSNLQQLVSLKAHWTLPGKRGAAQRRFKDSILKALDYQGLRKRYYPKHFQSIGIKACVYCNSQLAISLEKDKKVKAKFQVDHFISKSEYPCFSISLFNLYPVCGPCNNSKKEKSLNFELYVSTVSKSPFTFELDHASIIEYFITRKTNDLKISFDGNDKTVASQFREMFDIEGIYETQKDLAEEIIWKSEIYTPQYKADLRKNFKELFADITLTNRVIVGSYTDETDIHLRPMSKFTMDIARQLGLIDK